MKQHLNALAVIAWGAAFSALPVNASWASVELAQKKPVLPVMPFSTIA